MNISLDRALIASALLTFSIASVAGPGDLDTSFGAGGRATVAFNIAAGTFDDRVIAAIPEGPNTLLLGTVTPLTTSGNRYLAFARVDGNGQLDPNFAMNGKFITETYLATLVDADSDTSGRIYVTGAARDTVNGDTEFAVLRFLPTGELDSDYGLFGMATISFDAGGANNDVPVAITVSPSGEALVAGDVDGPAGARDFGLIKLDSTGALERAFSGDGKVTLRIGTGKTHVTAISDFDDSHVYLAGHDESDAAQHRVVVASFNVATGALDGAFCAAQACASGAQGSTIAGGGARTLSFDRASGAVSDEASAIAIASDGSGRVAVVGSSTVVATGKRRAAIAVMNAQGVIPDDASINTGRALLDLGASTEAVDVIHRGLDDHWIVAGNTTTGTTTQGFASYLTATPTLDTGFTTSAGNPSATQLISFPNFGAGTPLETRLRAVVLDDTQRLVLSGYRLWQRFSGVEDNDFAITRLSGDLVAADAVFKNGFEGQP